MSEDHELVTHLVSEGGVVAQLDLLEKHALRVAPTTNDRANLVKLGPIPIACWRVEDMRFEFDSSFVKPAVATEIQNLKLLRDANKQKDPATQQTLFPPLTIFGHADPTGNDDYNKGLSGRRATAIYALLTRDTALWEDLWSHPQGNDNWGLRAVQIMLADLGFSKGAADGKMNEETREAVKKLQKVKGLAVDGDPGPKTRAVLFLLYMDKLCGPDFKLDKNEDFLGRGADPGGKADFQGCSEFNPVMLFTEQEEQKFSRPENKPERDAENGTNRRVMALLFRIGSRVDPQKWPCPRVKEGVAGCKKRFWSDGEQRRKRRLPDERREFKKSKDTFACRFYHRMNVSSPCEGTVRGDGLLFMQCFSGDGLVALAGRRYRIRSGDQPPVQFAGVLDETGTLRHVLVPPGDYTLTVKGCGEDSPLAVLRASETIPQIRLLENGRLAIHVHTSEGDPLEDATVEVEGLGQRVTDEDGVAYYGTVPEGDFKFKASKSGFVSESVARRRQNFVKGGPGTTADAGEDSNATGNATVNDTRTDVTVKLTKLAKEELKILKIEAKQSGTHSRRNSQRQLPPTTLTPSTSGEKDMGKNPPVVVVRGSHKIALEAITEPPGQVVQWEITPNQSSGAPPDLSSQQAPNIVISTDKTGSFSVTAKLGSTSIIWNFILVEVEVDLNSATTARQNLTDLNEFIKTPEGKKTVGLGVGDTYDPTKMTGVASGTFEFGKHAWSSEVKVKLKGGGTAGDLGCDKVRVRFLQNISEIRTVGEYKTKLAVEDTLPPLLDAPGGSESGYDGPVVGAGLSAETKQVIAQSPFLHSTGMFQVVKNNPTERIFQVGDSPAVGFNTREQKINDEKLERIRGKLEFRIAVASFSADSVNSIVVHADAIWHVDYTGDVSISSGIGKWSSDGAEVKTDQEWKAIRDSLGNQGTTAFNALFEIFPPLAAKELAKEKKFIDKP